MSLHENSSKVPKVLENKASEPSNTHLSHIVTINTEEEDHESRIPMNIHNPSYTDINKNIRHRDNELRDTVMLERPPFMTFSTACKIINILCVVIACFCLILFCTPSSPTTSYSSKLIPIFWSIYFFSHGPRLLYEIFHQFYCIFRCCFGCITGTQDINIPYSIDDCLIKYQSPIEFVIEILFILVVFPLLCKWNIQPIIAFVVLLFIIFMCKLLPILRSRFCSNANSLKYIQYNDSQQRMHRSQIIGIYNHNHKHGREYRSNSKTSSMNENKSGVRHGMNYAQNVDLCGCSLFSMTIMRLMITVPFAYYNSYSFFMEHWFSMIVILYLWYPYLISILQLMTFDEQNRLIIDAIVKQSAAGGADANEDASNTESETDDEGNYDRKRRRNWNKKRIKYDVKVKISYIISGIMKYRTVIKKENIFFYQLYVFLMDLYIIDVVYTVLLVLLCIVYLSIYKDGSVVGNVQGFEFGFSFGYSVFIIVFSLVVGCCFICQSRNFGRVIHFQSQDSFSA